MIVNSLIERIWSRSGILVLCLLLLTSRASLWNNNIGPEGACAFAETLRTNTTLTVLE